ncbi:MAG: hypothetical protein AAFQ94_05190 [Bacteroidota bacterium]
MKKIQINIDGNRNAIKQLSIHEMKQLSGGKNIEDGIIDRRS